MADQSPQQVGKSYRLHFNISESAGPSEISKKLEATWFGDSRGLGGRELDDILGDLGKAIIDEGRVKWIGPARLDRDLRHYLARSVEELNRRLDAGDLIIDVDGNIRPSEGD
jgi:hypothetical protein